jgi:LysM repeat protein
MKRFYSGIVAALLVSTGAFADTNPKQIQDLNGTWVVRMDNVIDGRVGAEDGTGCSLSITSDNKAFQGRFNGCMEGVVINGNIYDDKLVLAVQSKENDLGSFCTFSGKVSPDGAIRGTYYTATTSGDFEWSNTGLIEQPKPKPVVVTPPPPVAIPEGTAYIPKGKGGTGVKPKQEVVTTYNTETKPAAVEEIEALPKPNANTMYHVVEEGESMYQIRKKYGLSTKKYLWLTQKTNDRLDVGERLRVSE